MNRRTPMPSASGAFWLLPGAVPFPEERAQFYRAQGLHEGIALDQILEASAKKYPEKIAVVCGERRISYGSLDERVNQKAAGFFESALRSMDRVVLQLDNRYEFIESFFALLRLGAIPIMALPGHRKAEISYFLRHTKARAYICADRAPLFDFRQLARELKSEFPELLVYVVGEAEEFINYETVQAEPLALPKVNPRQVALLQLSGGSTGTPKLIPRTHDDYLCSVRYSVPVCGIDEDTRYLVALPAAHNFPLSSAGILGAMLAGATTIFARDPSPDTVFALLAEERVTVLAAVPPLANTWAEACLSRGLSFPDLQILQVGGARLEEAHARKLRETFACTLQQVFGMAEGLVNYTRIDDSLEVIDKTQGRPMCPYDEVRVVDESGAVLPAGEVGELETRGPYTICGYYDAADHNRTAFSEDGFYRTGDLVRLDAAGNITVCGRKKEQINRGGEKIAPAELEEILAEHPLIQEVAVVGVPDATLGERTWVFYVKRDGGTFARPVLVKFLREAGLATFKMPDRLQALPELPRTSVGKIDKKRLQKEASA